MNCGVTGKLLIFGRVKEGDRIQALVSVTKFVLDCRERIWFLAVFHNPVSYSEKP